MNDHRTKKEISCVGAGQTSSASPLHIWGEEESTKQWGANISENPGVNMWRVAEQEECLMAGQHAIPPGLFSLFSPLSPDLLSASLPRAPLPPPPVFTQLLWSIAFEIHERGRLTARENSGIKVPGTCSEYMKQHAGPDASYARTAILTFTRARAHLQ